MIAQIEWRPLTGFKDHEVSNLGHLRNKKTGRILSLFKTKKGYLQYNIRNDEGRQVNLLIHRMVMQEFVGPSEQQVNHKDGNKSNNHIDNLEYCTQSENIKHAFKYDLYTRRGEQNPAAKLNWEKVDEIRLLAQLKNYTHKQIAEMYGVSKSAITNIVSGKKWKEESRPKC